MSVVFPRERIRLRLDTESHKAALDQITQQPPKAWRGNSMQFEMGFFFNDQLLSTANIASVTMTVKDNADRNGPKLMEKVIDASGLNQILVDTNWTAGTDQHVVIDFTKDETLLDMGGNNTKQFWVAFVALTTDTPVRRFTLGSTVLTLEDDGTTSNSASLPPLGSNIIGLGALYDGAGAYTLAGLIAGRVYQFAIGTGDTNLVNGTETLTASGSFAAQGTSVVLHGTASGPVTATVRWPLYLTADEADARYLNGVLKLINAPGVNIGMRSLNKRYMRQIGVDDNGNQYDHIIDLNA